MPEPFADTLATVAAGRTALVTRLRTIAARLEELPLDSAAEVSAAFTSRRPSLERDDYDFSARFGWLSDRF